MSRHVTRALATALCIASGSSSALAEPTEPVIDRTSGLVSGIGLVVVGAGAAAGAGFYALGRLPYGDTGEQHGPSGGTLAIVGAIGSVGLIIGITVTVLASTPSPNDARKPKAPRARISLGPGGARLVAEF